MSDVSMRDMLEAGVHFGHQTRYWNPKMGAYIFGQRNKIHIINLERTLPLYQEAMNYLGSLAANGGKVLFVGTKKQAQEAVEEAATRCNMYYVNQRWIGGVLTNFATIQARIDYLVRLEDQQARGEFSRLPKKEALKLEKEIAKLNKQMGGFKEMTSIPAALFIIDPPKEKIALAEAKRVGIPVVAIADTSCNPDEIDYPVPANDDAIRAIRLICNKIADAVLEGTPGQEMVQSEEVKSPEDTVVTEVTEEADTLVLTPDDE